LIYPGKEPAMFYFCLGKMSKTLLHSKSKINWSFNILVLVSLLIHFCISLLFWIHHWKEKKTVKPFQKSFSVGLFIIEKMKKDSLFR
jgi:hypothetical protein